MIINQIRVKVPWTAFKRQTGNTGNIASWRTCRLGGNLRSAANTRATSVSCQNDLAHQFSWVFRHRRAAGNQLQRSHLSIDTTSARDPGDS